MLAVLALTLCLAVRFAPAVAAEERGVHRSGILLSTGQSVSEWKYVKVSLGENSSVDVSNCKIYRYEKISPPPIEPVISQASGDTKNSTKAEDSTGTEDEASDIYDEEFQIYGTRSDSLYVQLSELAANIDTNTLFCFEATLKKNGELVYFAELVEVEKDADDKPIKPSTPLAGMPVLKEPETEKIVEEISLLVLAQSFFGLQVFIICLGSLIGILAYQFSNQKKSKAEEEFEKINITKFK